MPSLTVLALLGAIVYTVVNVLRFLAGREYGRALTVAVAWAAGAGVLVIAAASQLGELVPLDFLGAPELTLADLNLADQVLVGFAVASAFSGVSDLLGAIDSSRSTAKPSLFASANRTKP